jgi:hypothetical protein
MGCATSRVPGGVGTRPAARHPPRRQEAAGGQGGVLWGLDGLCSGEGGPDWLGLGAADGDGVALAGGLMLAEGHGAWDGQGSAERPGRPDWPWRPDGLPDGNLYDPGQRGWPDTEPLCTWRSGRTSAWVAWWPADPAGVGDSAGWDEAAGSGSGRASGALMVSWASRWAAIGRSPA